MVAISSLLAACAVMLLAVARWGHAGSRVPVSQRHVGTVLGREQDMPKTRTGLAWLGGRLGRVLPESTRSHLSRGLVLAGRREHGAAEEILALCAITAVMLAGVAGLAWGVPGVALGGLAGMGVPVLRLWLDARRRSRLAQEELGKILDFLVIYTTAGVPLIRSLAHLSQVHSGILTPYLTRAVQDLLSGKTVMASLRPMMEEIAAEEMVAFASALARAERLGTPLKDFFVREARSLRKRRSLELQHKASLVPLKLTICTTVFFLPCLIVLVVFPNILAFIHR
ncbi:MAG: type II secretion system F family protein [Bacillota bacterium]